MGIIMTIDGSNCACYAWLVFCWGFFFRYARHYTAYFKYVDRLRTVRQSLKLSYPIAPAHGRAGNRGKAMAEALQPLSCRACGAALRSSTY